MVYLVFFMTKYQSISGRDRDFRFAIFDFRSRNGLSSSSLAALIVDRLEKGLGFAHVRGITLVDESSCPQGVRSAVLELLERSG